MSGARGRPNIVLITTDQQRADTIQAAGARHLWTPHLDWLSDSGIRCTSAFTDCPVCLPARTTIMNGRAAYEHGVMSNKWVDGAVDPATSLPGLLSRAGYQTRHIGKTHFGPGQRIHQGFEHVEPPADHIRWLAQQGEVDGYRHGLGGNEFSPAIDPLPAKLSLTSWITDRSLDFLETRDDTRPFFLWASYNHPHPPFTPSQQTWELYRDRPQPPRVTGDWSADFADIAPAFTAVTQELSMTQRFDDEQLAIIRRAYAACITEVDLQIGRIFGHLQEQKLLGDTWIIFTTDHGEMLGDHWLGGKCVPFDAASRIPFLIRPPHGNRDHRHDWRGSTTDATVCLADILPTCAGIAGAPVPESVTGQDLRGLLDGSLVDREVFFHSCMYLHAVRKGAWKLCRETIDGNELLFELTSDPDETRNRLDDGDCAEIRAELSALLDGHIERHGLADAAAHDPGVIGTTDHLPTATQPGLRSGRASAC